MLDGNVVLSAFCSQACSAVEPGNGTPMVVLLVFFGGDCFFQIFKVLKLFRFLTNRNSSSTTDW